MLTALVGLAASGGIVWAVRLIGTAALRREAMGFGDVTLMMMIGTFLGWQAGLILFFLAPFAGLVIGLMQLVLRRDDVIPYGPFLCLAAAAVVVGWAPIWNWAQPIFGLGWLVPAMLIVCLALLGRAAGDLAGDQERSLRPYGVAGVTYLCSARCMRRGQLSPCHMNWLPETITDFDAGRERIRTRRYGVIETVGGRLAAIHLRPWPKLVALPEIVPLDPRYHAAGDGRPLPAVLQPAVADAELSGARSTSSRPPAPATPRFAPPSRCSTRSPRSSGPTPSSATPATCGSTDRVMRRFGWEPHKPQRWHRNYIRRFYGSYPGSCHRAELSTAKPMLADVEASDLVASAGTCYAPPALHRAALTYWAA